MGLLLSGPELVFPTQAALLGSHPEQDGLDRLVSQQELRSTRLPSTHQGEELPEKRSLVRAEAYEWTRKAFVPDSGRRLRMLRFRLDVVFGVFEH